MKVNSAIININSDNAERMQAFYKEVVQLPAVEGMGPGAMDIGGGAILIIDGHNGVHGAAKEPQRVLFNFMVDDLKSEQKRLEGQGVKFIRNAGTEPWGGVISTFLDPDGNYCQIIEYKPEQPQA